MTSSVDLREQDNERDGFISLLLLELSLLRDLLRYSQDLMGLSRGREFDALTELLDVRGNLIQEIKGVDDRLRSSGLPGSLVEPAGCRLSSTSSEDKAIEEMLQERQEILRSLKAADEGIMSALSELKEEIAEALALLEKGRASTLAYSAPVYAGAAPVFLDRQK